MKHQIIFINGPRHSGKDTAADFIDREFLNVRRRKFAAPLKASCAAMFGISPDMFKDLEKVGNSLKLKPMQEFFGKSWVETLIWMSEDVMKPRFGSDVFGQLMVLELLKFTPAPFTVITDSGFEHEALPVIEQFGASNCHVFRIRRPGKTFEGDSRSYIFENEVPEGLTCYDINNEHEISMFKLQVLKRVSKIMNVERVFS